ncbi:MAG: hypothetical protein HRT71_09805 [Flavobacteriales bacterium]|nr:hypothetical protein [Flavobacteriales bacterium]
MPLLFLLSAFLTSEGQVVQIKNVKGEVKSEIKLGKQVIVRINSSLSNVLKKTAYHPLVDLELEGELIRVSDSSITIEGISREDYYENGELSGFYDLNGLFNTQEILLKDIILISRGVRAPQI